MYAIPDRRVRLLIGRKLHRHVVELKIPPLEGQRARGEPLHDEVERLGIDRLRLLRLLTVVDELGRHRAAAEADLEPPAAHLIEHADLLDHPQRMIERQRIDQRAKAQAFRALRDRSQEHAGARRHAKRRRVMLGDVIGVEAVLIVDLGNG